MKKKTASEELWDALESYELILHPNLFNLLKNKLRAAMDENKQQAYRDAKISDDALWVEKELKSLADRERQFPGQQSFFIKCTYKEFLRRFLKSAHDERETSTDA